MFYCEMCDQTLDGDWVEAVEIDGEFICIDCDVEAEEAEE